MQHLKEKEEKCEFGIIRIVWSNFPKNFLPDNSTMKKNHIQKVFKQIFQHFLLNNVKDCQFFKRTWKGKSFTSSKKSLTKQTKQFYHQFHTLRILIFFLNIFFLKSLKGNLLTTWRQFQRRNEKENTAWIVANQENCTLQRSSKETSKEYLFRLALREFHLLLFNDLECFVN